MTLRLLTDRVDLPSKNRVRAIAAGRSDRRASAGRAAGRAVPAIIALLLSAAVPAAAVRAQEAPGPGAPEATRPAKPALRTVAPGEGREASPAPATTPPAGEAQPEHSTPPAPRTSRGFGSAAAPSLGEGPTCAFDATIYDLRLPADQIGRLDVDGLASAARTPEAFEKALAALGTAKPVYRANQSVRLSGDTLRISSQVPMVTNSRVTEAGKTVNTVQYQSVGAVFSLAGRAGASGALELDLNIQVSSRCDTGTLIADSVQAPAFRSDSLSHKGPVEARKPFVVVSVDAASADKEGKAVAYIARVKLGEPQEVGSK